MKAIIIGFLAFFALQSATAQSVGIGTNSPSPSAQLDVSSTSRGLLIPRMTAAQRIAIATPADGLLVYETSSKSFWFYNGGSWNQLGTGGSSPWSLNGNHIYNSNIGNVGIGTSTGLKEKLTVKGDIFVSFTNGNDLVNGGNRAEINLHGANSGTGVVNFLKPDTSLAASIFYSNVLGHFVLQNGSNLNQLFLRNNGNVGIGNNNPTQKLDIDGNIRIREDILADGKVIADGIVSGSGLQTPGNLAVGGVGFMNGNFSTNQNLSAGGNLTVGGSSLLDGAVTGNSTASFDGNIKSKASLTVDNPDGILTFRASGDDKAFAQLSGNDLRVGTFSSNTNGNFIVRTGGENRMIVNNLGNVGIGTTTPGSTLHVQGRGLFRGSAEVLSIDGTSNPGIGFYNNGNYKSFMYQSTNKLHIGVNGGNLHLDAMQIAIGTLVPAASGYKLTVSGKILCEELKVELVGAWPDYVFQKEYELMPLDDLKKFIHTNNHLPNIPSAASVEKSGIEIGDMQRRMMEKIEELTLYIIQLEEKVNGLAKK